MGTRTGSLEVVDQLGFIHSSTQAEDQSRHVRTIQRLMLKEKEWSRAWRRFLRRDGITHNRLKRKKLVRRGVPAENRKALWMLLLQIDRPNVADDIGDYNDILLGKIPVGAKAQILLDIPRTFPNNMFFQHPNTQDSLRRILCAFAACKPQIGYCQSLNFIAGFLFLVLQTEERAFRAMVQLLDSPDEDVGLHVADYYSPGLTGLRRDIQVVTVLLRKRLPAVLDKLDKLGYFDLTALVSPMFLTLFINNFSSHVVLRRRLQAPQTGIWDCMMQEGIKVLFRVILGLFKTYQDEILRDDATFESVYAFFRNRIPVLAQDPVMVLDIGFNLRGFRGHDLREGRREALKHLDEYVHTPRTPRPEESSYILTEQVAPLKQRLISLLSATSTNYLDDGSRTSTSTLDIVPRIFVPLRVKGDAAHRSVGSIRSLLVRTESMAPVSGDNSVSQSSMESMLTPCCRQRFRPPLPTDIRVYPPMSSYDSLTPATEEEEEEEEESPKSLTFAAESTATPQSCIRVDRLVEDFGSLLRAREFSSVSPRFENGDEMAAWCSCCNFHT